MLFLSMLLGEQMLPMWAFSYFIDWLSNLLKCCLLSLTSCF